MRQKAECLLFTLHRARSMPQWCGCVSFSQIRDDRLWVRLWSVSPIWVSYVVRGPGSTTTTFLQGGLLSHHVSLDPGGLSCYYVFPDPATCYSNSVLRRARPQAAMCLWIRSELGYHHAFLKSRATTCRGRQGTFKPAVGSQAATAIGMVCPLRRDSTMPTTTRLALFWVKIVHYATRQCGFGD
jgi:hypothetical protein